MPKQKGTPKTPGSGRTKGTPNKITAEIQAMNQTFADFFKEKNFNCAEEWYNIYEAFRMAPEQLLYMDIRVKVLERITDRIHGKVKEKDDTAIFQVIPIEVKKLPTHELIERARNHS